MKLRPVNWKMNIQWGHANLRFFISAQKTIECECGKKTEIVYKAKKNAEVISETELLFSGKFYGCCTIQVGYMASVLPWF